MFLGQNEPLYSMVLMGMWTHAENFKEVYGDWQSRKARDMRFSGIFEEKPFEFDLWYTPAHYGDTEVDLAAVLKDQFEATKMMKVTVKSAEWATYKENWRNQVMPIFLLGWYPDYIDPDNYTAAFAGTAGSAGLVSSSLILNGMRCWPKRKPYQTLRNVKPSMQNYSKDGRKIFRRFLFSGALILVHPAQCGRRADFADLAV